MRTCRRQRVCSALTSDSRLVQDIRQAGGSNTGLLTQMWDFNLEEKEAEFRDDLRDASGVGRSRKGKKVHLISVRLRP